MINRKKINPIKTSVAFTLAEVLITLLIIGIIAILSISLLLQNLRNREYVAGAQKAYSVISNVIQLSQLKHGDLTTWHWEKGEDYVAETYILPYLNVAKNCKTGPGCFPDITYKNLNSTSWGNLSSWSYYKFQLNDGTVWGNWIVNPDCLKEPYSDCYRIHVDVNGKKGPNQAGRDVFVFNVFPFTNKAMPQGYLKGDPGNASYDPKTKSWATYSDETINSECSTAYYGAFCAAKVIREGKMDY